MLFRSSAKNNITEQSDNIPVNVLSNEAKKTEQEFYYMTQVAVKPPTFVMFVNDKELTHFSYTRYIENKIREAFGFRGTALRFINRERKDKE